MPVPTPIPVAVPTPTLALTDFLSYSGDFNASGKQDILWRNTRTGEVRLWYMNGLTVVANDAVATVGLDWQFIGIGDFDGSGFSDIVSAPAGARIIPPRRSLRAHDKIYFRRRRPAEAENGFAVQVRNRKISGSNDVHGNQNIRPDDLCESDTYLRKSDLVGKHQVHEVNLSLLRSRCCLNYRDPYRL